MTFWRYFWMILVGLVLALDGCGFIILHPQHILVLRFWSLGHQAKPDQAKPDQAKSSQDTPRD